MCHLQREERLLCPSCPQASPQSHMTLNLMTMSIQCQIDPVATQSLVGALQVWQQVHTVPPDYILTAV